jgi:hypothetical protein
MDSTKVPEEPSPFTMGRKMQITLTLERKGAEEALAFHYTRMVNAGYVGRNQEEVRRHIEELAAKGISGPQKTPTLYPVIPRMLVSETHIDVYGDQTSGEVEYVLLVRDRNTIYVGLGSDHTDRHLEETDIPRAKQICPNIIGPKVWLLDEVRDHWDELEIESLAIHDGQEEPYQKGLLKLILDPGALMEFVGSKVKGPLEGMVIFSGTLGTLTGGFVYGEGFAAKLTDPRLGRKLDLRYAVRPMDYLTVD